MINRSSFLSLKLDYKEDINCMQPNLIANYVIWLTVYSKLHKKLTYVSWTIIATSIDANNTPSTHTLPLCDGKE